MIMEKKELRHFDGDQLRDVNDAVAMAEELVCNHYKMSDNQWLRLRYDIRTLADLSGEEIVYGPFAQVIRYEGKPKGISLGSLTYDFYKICLQDHCILLALAQETPVSQALRVEIFPFLLYIITHELVHVVRFCRFLQNFNASAQERQEEEIRVHEFTRLILEPVKVSRMDAVFRFYDRWHPMMDQLS